MTFVFAFLLLASAKLSSDVDYKVNAALHIRIGSYGRDHSFKNTLDFLHKTFPETAIYYFIVFNHRYVEFGYSSSYLSKDTSIVCIQHMQKQDINNNAMRECGRNI